LLAVFFDEGEGGDEDGVVDGDEGFGVEGLEEEVGGFAFVVGKEALVEAGVVGDGGLVAEEDGEELERGDVAAHDDEADGEGYGQDEAYGPPDEGPESGGDEDGEGRESGVTAVDVGLDVVAGDDLEKGEDAGDEDGVLPSVEDGDGEEDGNDAGDGDSDVGNESTEAGKRSEENGVGQPDEVERSSDDRAEGEVDSELKKEVAGDALGGVAHGLRHESEVAIAGEPDEAVAKVLALEEYEKSEDDGKECGGEGRDDSAELVETACGAADFADLKGMFRGGAYGLFLNFFWRLEGGGCGGVDDAEFVADLFEFGLNAADGGVAGAVEGVELEGYVLAVGGEVVGNGDELGEDGPCGDEEERGESEDDDEGGGGARETKTLFEKSHHWSKKEGEEDGDAEGEEENLGEIKDSDGKYSNGEKPELRQKACGW